MAWKEFNDLVMEKYSIWFCSITCLKKYLEQHTELNDYKEQWEK
jgi:hypothetical protein